MKTLRTLNDLLDDAAQTVGSRVYLAEPERETTFAQMRQAALATAAGLQAAGVKKGDCVAIVHRNSRFFVQAYLALSRLGAVAVPINFMVQKADELAYMLNDCGAKGVVTQREFLRGLRAARAKALGVERLWVTDAQNGLEPGEEPFAKLESGPAEPAGAEPPAEEDTASILYTSGTTGSPKGVMLTHRNFVTNAEASIERLGLKDKDVALCILPMFHSFAWTGLVVIGLRLRLKVVVFSNIAPPTPWLKAMAKQGVTVFAAVPQIYSVLAKQAKGLQGLALRYWFFRKIRICISGAAPLSPATAQAFKAAFGVPILEGFGLTETSPVATINPPDRPKPGSVGTPIRGVRVKIVDDQERDLKPGQEGEVCIAGDCVMKGYYRLPDATREAMTADGWFKTGDIGVLDPDGYLSIRDRKKDMIIIKGLKVFSAQVEATLLEHPGIEEAAIIGVPDEHGDETIKAFIVPRKGVSLDKASLMQFCRTKFDPYKRPRDIELVESLPKNALQKVLKRTLRQQELDKRASSSGAA